MARTIYNLTSSKIEIHLKITILACQITPLKKNAIDSITSNLKEADGTKPLFNRLYSLNYKRLLEIVRDFTKSYQNY